MVKSYRQSNICTAILGGILASSMLTQAVPLTARQNNYPDTTTTTNTPANTTYASGSAPFEGGAVYTGPTGEYPAPVVQIFPEYTSQYNVKTGAHFHTSQGLVSRSPTNGGADITTLVTFEVPAEYSSNWCQVAFTLEDASSWASGSLQAQLYTSLAPASTIDASSWPSGNLRDQFLGSIDVVAGGEASFEAGSGPAATSHGFFPCGLIAGRVYGGEIVPRGDSVQISWPAAVDGIKIVVY